MSDECVGRQDSMDVIFLINDIHLGAGGERVTVNLANYLVERNYKVSITSICTSKAKRIFSIDQRIGINYLNVKQDQGFKIINKLKSVFSTRKHFAGIKNQAVILGIGTYPALLLALLSKNKNIRTIGCQHLSWSAVPGIWKIAAKVFFSRLDCLVTLTSRDAEQMGSLNKEIRTIPNAVSFFPGTPAPLVSKNMLAIGRLDHVKGFDLLIKVFQRFSVQNHEWNVRIVGEGPLREELNSEISRVNLEERVRILPWTDSVTDEYLNSSIYLMTSRAEGFPMVLLEAQACGLPIVSFDCKTGPAEIIHQGIDGFLVEPYDIDKMAEHLLELCSDIDKRRLMGNNGRENARNYLPEKVGKQWEELFTLIAN